MARKIRQRILSKGSFDPIGGLAGGESIVVDQSGVTPSAHRPFVSAASMRRGLDGSPPLDPTRFREDVDRLIDQGFEPRA